MQIIAYIRFVGVRLAGRTSSVACEMQTRLLQASICVAFSDACVLQTLFYTMKFFTLLSQTRVLVV